MQQSFPAITKELLLEIMENCFTNIFVADAQGYVIYLNEGAARVLGRSRAELLGTNVRHMVEDGLADCSVTAAALSRLRTYGCRVVGSTGIQTTAMSQPVFGTDGKLKLVVSNNLTEENLQNFIDSLFQKRTAYQDAVSCAEEPPENDHLLICHDGRVEELLQIATRLAHTDSTIILYGESGTGKEVMARHIHRHSARMAEPFIPVNCSAIPGELMEAEFFGYVSGAFTGAEKGGRKGLFEIADTGTLFLDEIGELPPAFQSKLLRTLESGEYRPVGGNRIKMTRTRILAATNRNLESMVSDGRFRADLFYRLNVIPLTLPPLRERAADIIPLAGHFLRRFNRQYNTCKQFAPEAMAVFRCYVWPGNIRELRNVIERLVLIGRSDTISGADCDFLFKAKLLEDSARPAETGISLQRVRADCETETILGALNRCNGRVSAAAKLLGMHRSGLYRKIRALGLKSES